MSYGVAEGLGTPPGCGSTITGFDGLYGGGVTGAYVGAGCGVTRLTGTGMYGAGDICTKASVFVGVRMLGCGFFGDGMGVGAGPMFGPGVIGLSGGSWCWFGK